MQLGRLVHGLFLMYKAGHVFHAFQDFSHNVERAPCTRQLESCIMIRALKAKNFDVGCAGNHGSKWKLLHDETSSEVSRAWTSLFRKATAMRRVDVRQRFSLFYLKPASNSLQHSFYKHAKDLQTIERGLGLRPHRELRCRCQWRLARNACTVDIPKSQPMPMS